MARSRWTSTATALATLAAACSFGGGDPTGGDDPPGAPGGVTTAGIGDVSTTASSAPTSTTTVPTFPLRGTVTTSDGTPLPDATVSIGALKAVTGGDGSFLFPAAPAGTIAIDRPAWISTEVDWPGSPPSIAVTLEPFQARALRVSGNAAGNPARFAELVALAEASSVNAFVFDTKDESGRVLYETGVQEARDIGAMSVVYDPAEVLAIADAAGLYSIARVVSFHDPARSEARSEARLDDLWVDPTDPANWLYPLALAEEACRLGFDEIQLDYVRFPTIPSLTPDTQEERVAVIAGYLEEAIDRLHPLGCAVSADVFAIVFSSPNDQGIGQRPEELSLTVDVISPMIYPSHYSDGWLGFDDPNDHPAAVTADALDDGMPRVSPITQVRPWLQAFGYTGPQVLAGIEESEQRDVGWMLWNIDSVYPADGLPPEPQGGGG